MNRAPFVFSILGGALIALTPTQLLADQRCRQLEALGVKYASASLTADQKELKVKLVAWYEANCGRHEVADEKPAAISSSTR